MARARAAATKRPVGDSGDETRPASRARRIASGGAPASPEKRFLMYGALAGDILNGAVDPSDANAVCTAGRMEIMVAHNADLLAEMDDRCEGLDEDGFLRESKHTEMIAALEAELAELKRGTARTVPHKG